MVSQLTSKAHFSTGDKLKCFKSWLIEHVEGFVYALWSGNHEIFIKESIFKNEISRSKRLNTLSNNSIQFERKVQKLVFVKNYFAWSTPHSKRWYQKELANKSNCLSQNGGEIVFKWNIVTTKAPKRFKLGSFK